MTDEHSAYDDIDKVMAETGVGNKKFLRFKKGDKGRRIQIRLLGEPIYIIQHWITTSNGKQEPVECKGEKCEYCGEGVVKDEKIDKNSQWAWPVIDREDEEIKIFTGTIGMANNIRNLKSAKDTKENPIYGDPLTYDILIERTEKTGSYYKVDPVPSTKGELSEDEKKRVAEANLDLSDAFKGGGKKSQNVGNYGKAAELETAPEEKKEVKGTTPKQENVDPDDIPF